ncbi:MAG: glycosyltransferase, partial [Candidatus Bathyarchaeia archaeon]
MGSDPRILVIICAKDERPYLAKCLNALLSQSLSDLSIAVVDDGSSDGTYELAQSYADRHKNIKAIKRPQTLIRWRSYGISIARAFNYALETMDLEAFDYLAKIDADVILAEGYFK